jgi:hypothetical protein
LPRSANSNASAYPRLRPCAAGASSFSRAEIAAFKAVDRARLISVSAKAFGLNIPLNLQAFAEEVIE